jgi:hypothetical protein
LQRSTGFLESVFCSTAADLSVTFAVAAPPPAGTNRIGLKACGCKGGGGATEYVITRCDTTAFTDGAAKLL